MDRCAWWYCTGSGALTQPSGKGEVVDPRARALLRIQQQAEHVAAAHGVGAVVTRLPENHGIAAEGIEADLLRGAALGSGEDEAGVDHGRVALGAIVSRKGSPPSQFPQHVVHLIGVDGGVIPTHAVASLAKVGSDLTVGHAPHELVPRLLQSFPKRDARLSGVVEELIVPDPQGGVPGFVVGESVHGVLCLN